MSDHRSEIIVGIDFGTTFSGVSWALNEGSKKIRVITDWSNPTAIVANDVKVPSIISYKNDKVQNWGYEVTAKEEAFRWTKILLEPEPKYANMTREVQRSDAMLRIINKTADEVVADYLRQIWEYTKEDIRKRVGQNDWESVFTVHIVLTVPAMWSHAAKDKTLKAGEAAGLPSSVRLVTEPEAAALATLRDKAKENKVEKGDAFVVCDAGGGTVDLISYKVISIQPLRIEECAIGDGGLCGSVFLDIAFEKQIKALVGEAQYGKIKIKDRKNMLKLFEFGVKRCFTLDSTKNYTVELHGIEDNQEFGVYDETINLEPSMLKTVFNQVCSQIDNLVEGQVQQVRESGSSVKAILLVGGFGSSKYLHKHLESIYSSQGVVVFQVDGAWSAVCRGACMWGLEHIGDGHDPSPQGLPLGTQNGSQPQLTVVSRISKCSYGVVLSERFDPKQHLEEDRFTDPADGSDRAKNQMTWLLRRGDRVEEGRILTLKIIQKVKGDSHGKRSFTEPLLFCDQVGPPTRRNDYVKQLCTVGFDVPEPTIQLEKSYDGYIAGETWRDMTFDLSIKLGSADMHYAIHYRGERVGHVRGSTWKTSRVSVQTRPYIDWRRAFVLRQMFFLRYPLFLLLQRPVLMEVTILKAG